VDLSRFSRKILKTTCGLTRGEAVWIDCWDDSLDLANAMAYECEKMGCHSIVTERSEKRWLWHIQKGSISSLQAPSPQQHALLQATDLYIFMLGPPEPIDWNKVPSSRRKDVTIWFLENNNFVKKWLEIAKSKKIRMVGIEATIASPSRSKVLGLEYKSWRKVMFLGCLADYHEVSRIGHRLKRLLARRRKVRIESTGGTELSLELYGKEPILNDGLATEKKAREGRIVFLPAGDLEVAVKEDSAKGTVIYDTAIRTRKGIVRELTVRVDKGKVVSYEAASGGEIFGEYIERTKGKPGVLSFMGFGLNPKLKFGFTQDDKVMGGLTIGFGDNYLKGGMNRAAGDWWGSVTESTVDIDGMRVMQRGEIIC
jgi:leucyl aminopeptidase (aminopeptidase T)